MQMQARTFLLRFSRVLALVMLCAVITVLNSNFLTVRNILNVLRQAAPQTIMAIGMTMALLTGGIDLSMGSVTTLSSVVTAYVMVQLGVPWFVSMVAGLVTGVLSGLINGLLISRAFLPPAIATFGMLWIARGLSFALMGANTIFGFPRGFRLFGIGYWLGIPIPVLLMAGVAVVATLFLNYSTAGRSIYAVGANPEAANASGIKTRRTILIAYMLSGLMAAVAGIMLCARLNAVDQNSGAPFLLPAIASAVMGGTSMRGGEGGVGGTIIGSLIMMVLGNGMNLLRISSVWQQFVIGVVVVLAVWFDITLKKKQG